MKMSFRPLRCARRPPGHRYPDWSPSGWTHRSGAGPWRMPSRRPSPAGSPQNVIVRPLTYVAPAYDAIIEELFPAEAMTDPMVFYNAAGDEVRRKRDEKAMGESGGRVIAFDKTT